MKTFDYQKIENAIKDYVSKRNWDQFHSPKNLSMALSVEASELVEIFQWMSEGESSALRAEKKQQVEREMADIAYYLVLLAAKLDVNLEEAMLKKMEENIAKYPVDKALNNSKKYNEF